MSTIRRMLCKLFGHRYIFKRSISRTIYEISCKRCKREFGVNTDVEVVLPLTPDLKKLHEEIINKN